MGESNVERFQRLRPRLPELGREALADGAEWVNPADAVETGTRRGADAFLRAVARVFEGWDESTFEVERVLESGSDVVALGALRTRAQGDLEVTGEHAEIWTFADGKVTRMRWFRTHAEALSAAGLAAPTAD
jgi:ketosteroid isomerase-like protein